MFAKGVTKISSESVVAVLTDAQRRIKVPTSWAKGEYAFDENYETVLFYEDDAVKWCPLGTLLRSTWEHLGRVLILNMSTSSPSISMLVPCLEMRC